LQRLSTKTLALGISQIQETCNSCFAKQHLSNKILDSIQCDNQSSDEAAAFDQDIRSKFSRAMFPSDLMLRKKEDENKAMETDLWVVAADISNAFLDGKNIDKTMIKAWPEFEELQVSTSSSKVVGTAIKAATFHAHIAAKLQGK
jgi:hypothetical protein